MTATNVNIAEFINVLQTLSQDGTTLVNLDMVPDDNHPSMNKIVIYPVSQGKGGTPTQNKVTIRNPNIGTDGDDIFNKMYN
jgi:hypothetical protein